MPERENHGEIVRSSNHIIKQQPALRADNNNTKQQGNYSKIRTTRRARKVSDPCAAGGWRAEVQGSWGYENLHIRDRIT